jgi:hypothetical protein
MKEIRMPQLQPQLVIQRCPHCKVDTPNLSEVWSTNTQNHSGVNRRAWKVYVCSRCGGLVTASSISQGQEVTAYFPSVTSVDDSVPAKAREFLTQALNSLHAPAGAVMLTASAVDAMLKDIGYKDGSLYNRIKQASNDHLITSQMADWAHDIRLDANDQRHAEATSALPSDADASRCIDFAMALAQFLFVLPSRVKRGLEEVAGTHKKAAG